MDPLNDTPTSRKNKHLNDFERGKIELLDKQGYPYAIGKI
nr:helix-turn-helix domain-containing protein [Natranaerobius trueperi]